jgi:hypothetical protein
MDIDPMISITCEIEHLRLPLIAVLRAIARVHLSTPDDRDESKAAAARAASHLEHLIDQTARRAAGMIILQHLRADEHAQDN